jgi:hypothetical protein
MAYGLLLGEDKNVAAWAFSTFNRFPMPVDRAIGLISPVGDLKGAVLFQHFNGINVEMSYYGPNTLSAGIVRSIARVIITEFKAARLTVVTSKRNKRLMKALTRLGFSLEGSQRRFFGHRDCTRNTGVRFVAFHEKICKVAGVQPSSFEQ